MDIIQNNIVKLLDICKNSYPFHDNSADNVCIIINSSSEFEIIVRTKNKKINVMNTIVSLKYFLYNNPEFNQVIKDILEKHVIS